MPSSTPIVLADGQGEHLWYDGGLLTFKATGAQTGGALLLFEVRMPGGKATPLHVHPDADETFRVLDGAVRLHVEGSDADRAARGAVVVIPRGTPHAFEVEAVSVHMLVALTPASTISEEFFRRAGEPATDPSQTPPPPAAERFGAAVESSGLRVLGPPPFAPPELVAG
jgi:quercetin dioxygenase-like cupin family protein